MTRLARRASLLVAFYLLTSAAMAYAECAWVLWSMAAGPAAPKWFPSDAFQTREEPSLPSMRTGSLSRHICFSSLLT
jgi:hypothetical protein